MYAFSIMHLELYSPLALKISVLSPCTSALFYYFLLIVVLPLLPPIWFPSC